MRITRASVRAGSASPFWRGGRVASLRARGGGRPAVPV